MTTQPEIKLPPLPECDSYCTYKDSHDYDVWNAENMQAFARAAVLADRAARAKAVISWATHHDEPMLFPTRAEALQYCDEGEPPIALVAAPTQERTPAPTLGDPS